MSISKKISVALICLFAGNNINAQIGFNTIHDLWAYAEKHNIQIKTMQAGKSIAEKNVQQAYGAILPTVSANGAFTDNIKIQSTLIPANLFNPAVPAGTYTEATFGRRYIYSANLTAQFDLLNTKDWFTIKTEKLNREIAMLNIAKSKADLYEQLANAFYSYILVSRAEKLVRENLQTATALHDIANNKFKEGLLSEVTINTALINMEKAAKSLDIATENKWLQFNNIKVLLNTNDSISIADNIIVENIFVTDNLFLQDPNVKLSYTKLLVSKLQWQSNKAAFIPTLSAVYQYNTQVAADDFLEFKNSNTTPQQYWSLRLSVPIFSGNSKRYQVHKSKIDYNLKQQQYETTKLQSDIASQNILLSYNSARSAFEKAERILKLYQSNDAHADRRMNEGIISMDERLKINADLIANQNEYLESMSDYFIQQYRLKIRQTNFLE